MNIHCPLIADEPTSGLDATAAMQVTGLLKDIASETGTSGFFRFAELLRIEAF